MFEHLGKVGACKKLNYVEDEVNSHPDLMEKELDHNLDLAYALMGKVGRLRASVVSQLGKQADFTRPDPRDRQIAALARTVQTLLERLDSQSEQPGADTTLVVPASPLGSLVTLVPSQKKITRCPLIRESM